MNTQREPPRRRLQRRPVRGEGRKFRDHTVGVGPYAVRVRFRVRRTSVGRLSRRSRVPRTSVGRPSRRFRICRISVGRLSRLQIATQGGGEYRHCRGRPGRERFGEHVLAGEPHQGGLGGCAAIRRSQDGQGIGGGRIFHRRVEPGGPAPGQRQQMRGPQVRFVIENHRSVLARRRIEHRTTQGALDGVGRLSGQLFHLRGVVEPRLVQAPTQREAANQHHAARRPFLQQQGATIESRAHDPLRRGTDIRHVGYVGADVHPDLGDALLNHGAGTSSVTL